MTAPATVALPAVMVVDPDPGVLGFLRAALAGVAARVVAAPTVRAAAADPAAVGCRAAVVAVPAGGDPAADAAELQAVAPGARVVFTVNTRGADDTAELMALPGAAGVLAKPFSPGQLRAAVRGASPPG